MQCRRATLLSMRHFPVFLFCALSAAASFAQAPASAPSAAASSASAPTAAAETAVPSEPGLYATFDTSMGAIVVKLFEDKAPGTVKNFVDLAQGNKAAMNKAGEVVKHPYYNGLTFHRVIKGFMIQTGDIRGTGSSPCGFPDIKDEIDPSLHFDGVGRLAMANTGRPNSGGCQIFITVANTMFLDGKYTIFGQVVAGQDVATRISVVPTLPGDKPVIPVVVKSVKITRRS